MLGAQQILINTLNFILQVKGTKQNRPAAASSRTTASRHRNRGRRHASHEQALLGNVHM